MPEYQQTKQSNSPDLSSRRRINPTNPIPISIPASLIQRARINPKSLTHNDVMQLQRIIGNRAVGRLLSEIGLITSTTNQVPVQRQERLEEEETLQEKMITTLQRQEIPEKEKPLKDIFKIKPNQATFTPFSTATISQRQELENEEKLLQGKIIEAIQRQEIPEEKKPLQGQMMETIQCQENPEEEKPFQTKKENNTGIPDNLKAGVENLSGIDMSDVRVHYNSSKPAEVGALAYTQGTNIHVAPGQERHLPHEAWHVVQQKQERVRPTIQLEGLAVNEEEELEKEADVISNHITHEQGMKQVEILKVHKKELNNVIQGYFFYDIERNRIPEYVNKQIEDILVRENINTKTFKRIVSSKYGVDIKKYLKFFDILNKNIWGEVEKIVNIFPDADPFNIQNGPKAGFEIEFCNVLLFDMDKVTPYQINVLNGTSTEPSKKNWLKDASYQKHQVVFTSPYGTWDGTADTTLDICSNLELATKPLTTAQWNERAGEAKRDYDVMKEFIKNLNLKKEKTLFSPSELGVRIKDPLPKARLYKTDQKITPQMQMTAAVSVTKNENPVPKWWLSGLNWDAMPFLQHICNGLNTKNLGLQSNPKFAFKMDGRNAILKTPILHLLGKPEESVDETMKTTWVEEVAKMLKVNLDGEVGKPGIVDASLEKSPNMHLLDTEFKWKDYLANLLRGEDLVTTWASKAFEGEGYGKEEDLGLGQIKDETIDRQHVIKEFREFQGQNKLEPDYLELARSWARTGRGPE